jgi:hypothetical protein
MLGAFASGTAGGLDKQSFCADRDERSCRFHAHRSSLIPDSHFGLDRIAFNFRSAAKTCKRDTVNQLSQVKDGFFVAHLLIPA